MATAAASAQSTLNEDGKRTKQYRAKSIIYSASPSAMTIEKKFSSSVEINVASGVRSFYFRNDFGGDKKANTSAQVALSGQSAGFAVYDYAGTRLVEYTNGRNTGPAALFEIKSPNGLTRIRWFFGTQDIVSIVESYGMDGALAYSETTYYAPQ